MSGHCDGIPQDHYSADVAGLVLYLPPFMPSDPDGDLINSRDDCILRVGRIQHLAL